VYVCVFLLFAFFLNQTNNSGFFSRIGIKFAVSKHRKSIMTPAKHQCAEEPINMTDDKVRTVPIPIQHLAIHFCVSAILWSIIIKLMF